MASQDTISNLSNWPTIGTKPWPANNSLDRWCYYSHAPYSQFKLQQLTGAKADPPEVHSKQQTKAMCQTLPKFPNNFPFCIFHIPHHSIVYAVWTSVNIHKEKIVFGQNTWILEKGLVWNIYRKMHQILKVEKDLVCLCLPILNPHLCQIWATLVMALWGAHLEGT